MPTQQNRPPDYRTVSDSEATGARLVSDETLVLRNYDNRRHDLRVTFTDHNGETALNRNFSVGPRETVSIQSRLERAVYRVEARLETGARARADCLLGSDPDECAMIETGNGLVSVVEGHFC